MEIYVDGEGEKDRQIYGDIYGEGERERQKDKDGDTASRQRESQRVKD